MNYFELLCNHIKKENFDGDLFTPINDISTNRHTVYCFEKEGEKYVVKLFHSEEKFQNEINGYEYAKKKT